MKKLLTIMTAFVLALAVAMPVMAKSYEELEDVKPKVGKFEDNTSSDSFIGAKPVPDVSYDDNGNVTLTYNSADLKIVPKKTEINRNIDAAWIGFKATKPENAKSYKVTYNNETEGPVELDDSTEVKDWVAVTEEKLTDATTGKTVIEYVLKYVWTLDDDSTQEQTLTIRINPEGVRLKDKDGIEELWNKDEYDKVLAAATDKGDEEQSEDPSQEENKEEEKEEENTKENTEENTEEDEKDDTRDTGVENVYAIAGLVATVTLAGVVILNKRK